MDAKKEKYYDLVVIGGGPAGYAAAIKASQMNASAALVEREVLGGTCLNRGCIPTKTYLKNAEIIESIKKASNRGIKLKSTEFEIDMPAMLKMKNQVVRRLTRGVETLMESNKVDIYYGEARIRQDKSVLIDNSRVLSAGKLIIAGGSKPARISVPGIENPRVWFSGDILSIKTLPESLTVVGGGVIGVEMALIFLAFGIKVNIVESQELLLSSMDSSLSEFIETILRQKGGKIYKEARLEKVEENGTGLELRLSNGMILKSSHILIAVGRIADLSALGDTEIRTVNGFIDVDAYLETNISGIYAAGDLTGYSMLAHTAYKMGETAAQNTLGVRKEWNEDCIPSVVYSSPEIASVGLTEEEATRTRNVSIGYFPLSANGKALSDGESDGFVKIITDKNYGEVLGVHMAGLGVSELINEAAALMAMEVTSNEIADIIHAHPSVGEAFMEAAADSLGICLHLPPQSD